MWERCTELVEAQGSKVLLNTRVTKIRHENGRAVAVTAVNEEGGSTEYAATDVISSMPMSALLRSMDPPVPAEVQAAADDLHYRDYLTVALVVPERFSFPDNWIYVHSPEVKVGRIQNYGSWSPFLVKEGRTCLGLEYFVFEGDEYWSADDENLIELGKRELQTLGLVDASKVEAGYVVRMPKAYPTYDDSYKENVEIMKQWLDDHAPNVHPVGRNGMHRYNNQDHSMYTAMLTVENIVDDAGHDTWSVNVEEEYHEESSASDGDGKTGRDAPVISRAANASAAEARRASAAG